MTPLPLNLPPGAKVEFNSLYPVHQLRYLTEDILLVSLKDDIQIDVGWHPQWDANGAFYVSVFQGDWEKQLQEPFESPDPFIVATEVRNLAKHYH